MSRIAILIIAAGSSSRMEGPKQLLPLGKATMLEHILEQAKASGVDEVVCVLGGNYEKIVSKIAFFDTSTIRNEDWESGIGTSIAAGVRYIKNKSYDAVLVILGDQPLVDSSYLMDLIKAFRKDPSKIVATKYPKSNGVPAIFPAEYFQELIELKGDVGAKHLLNPEGTGLVVKEAGNKINDIDTPEDYNNILKNFDKS